MPTQAGAPCLLHNMLGADYVLLVGQSNHFRAYSFPSTYFFVSRELVESFVGRQDQLRDITA
jgi:hypothetical protein